MRARLLSLLPQITGLRFICLLESTQDGRALIGVYSQLMLPNEGSQQVQAPPGLTRMV